MGTKSSKDVHTILELAKLLFKESLEQPKTPFLSRIPPLLKFPSTKYFLINVLDTSLRPQSSRAANKHVKQTIERFPEHGVLFSNFESWLLKAYHSVGYLIPFLSIPLIKNRIKDVTSSVIHRIDKPGFKRLQHRRLKQGVKQNINMIGEALLGEDEALNRIDQYKELIGNPSVDYISIKISTLYSQINSLAHHETVEALVPKLESIYRHANRIEHNTGKKTFVNLDMEEYRDLSITIDLFKRVLDKPEFQQTYAGIVLQAYIPDSFDYLLDLQKWATKRIKHNGAPIKIRLVKGANLEMEKIESSNKQWPLTTHSSKLETDAQYKKMLFQAITPESILSIHIGVASHNIFDIAYAVFLIEVNQIKTEVGFEMLEGLAENYLYSLTKRNLPVLLYTPVIKKGHFLSAIAYLVRRFDESTAAGNFIREQIDLEIGSTKWMELETSFKDSLMASASISTQPKRTPFREQDMKQTGVLNFTNSIDTDWTISKHQTWAKGIVDKWKDPDNLLPSSIPFFCTQKDREKIRLRTWEKLLPWEFELADKDDIQEAIDIGEISSWINTSASERASILRKVGQQLESKRADLIGIGMLEVGKLIAEMDTEISEAVDFANYYAESSVTLERENGNFQGKGITLVLSPWNFPIAIPAGGILASLAAGNPVIIKPAKRSISCAFLLCTYMWEAGVPKDALQLLPAHSKSYASFLQHPSAFESVILTGGTETAKNLLSSNPFLNLYAETGGKNATILTSFADRELAIKHVLDSAFNNTGQKCSATSLLILDDEIYCDEQFMELLKDATESLKSGSPWELESKIGPMANPIDKKIKEEIHNSKNQWLLKGKLKNDHLISPSIILGASLEDTSVTEELFGPILTVLRAKNLKNAIDIVNQSAYGLTSGLESLNKDEIAYWKENIQAGNLYINRSTTGAIVKRQPFGGLKSSAFGPGMKAGGKNYLTQFLKPIIDERPIDLAKVKTSYDYWYESLFSKEIDEVHVRGQHNLTRYLKPLSVCLFADERIESIDLKMICEACKTINIPLTILFEKEPQFEIEQSFIVKPFDRVALSPNIRYRCISKETLPISLLLQAHKLAIHFYEGRPSSSGRFELLNYLQEQSISHDYHRYGNLMGQG